MYELRREIIIFLKEEKHSLVTAFEDGVFHSKLAYLCDIFEKLNISFQGRDTYILQLYEKLTAFNKKTTIMENWSVGKWKTV